MNYDEDKRVEKKQKIKKRFDELATTEEKCSYLYSFFTKKNVSKPNVAFELAQLIERNYSDKPEELKDYSVATEKRKIKPSEDTI